MGTKKRMVRCPNSKQLNAPNETSGSEVHVCQRCGEFCPIRPTYIPENKVKNRDTLLMSLVAYADAMDASALRVIRMPDGRLGSEYSFVRELTILTPDGEPYLVQGALDKVVRVGEDEDAEMVVPELKTTQKLADAQYFSQFEPAVQPSMYTWEIRAEFPDESPAPKVWIVCIQVAAGMTHIRMHQIHIPRAVTVEWEEDMGYWIKRAEADARDARNFELAGKSPTGAYRRNLTACNGLPGAPTTSCPFKRICTLAPSDREKFLQVGYVTKD